VGSGGCLLNGLCEMFNFIRILNPVLDFPRSLFLLARKTKGGMMYHLELCTRDSFLVLFLNRLGTIRLVSGRYFLSRP